MCRRERGNAHDAFAVAVEKESRIIGHVPRNKLSTCSLLLELTQYQLAHAHYSDIEYHSQITEICPNRPVLSAKISQGYIFTSYADSPKSSPPQKKFPLYSMYVHSRHQGGGHTYHSNWSGCHE